MTDLVARARAALDGIDTQVVSAARELSQEQKQNPEWVWVQAVAKRPSMSFGRWQKNSLAAPYVRLDLVLPHLDRIEALEAENARLRYGLECVYQYGSDTLVGPSQGVPDDRTWQRDGVLIMTARARATLEGASEQDIVSIRAPFASPLTPETSHD